MKLIMLSFWKACQVQRKNNYQLIKGLYLAHVLKHPFTHVVEPIMANKRQGGVFYVFGSGSLSIPYFQVKTGSY